MYIDPKVSRPGIPSLLVYTSTGRVLGDFVHIFRRDLCREKILPNLAAQSLERAVTRGRGAQDLRSRGEDDFLQLQHDEGQSNYSGGLPVKPVE